MLAVRRMRDAHRARLSSPPSATIVAHGVAYDGFTKSAGVTFVTSIAGENCRSNHPKPVRFFCNASREILPRGAIRADEAAPIVVARDSIRDADGTDRSRLESRRDVFGGDSRAIFELR